MLFVYFVNYCQSCILSVKYDIPVLFQVIAKRDPGGICVHNDSSSMCACLRDRHQKFQEFILTVAINCADQMQYRREYLSTRFSFVHHHLVNPLTFKILNKCSMVCCSRSSLSLFLNLIFKHLNILKRNKSIWSSTY